MQLRQLKLGGMASALQSQTGNRSRHLWRLALPRRLNLLLEHENLSRQGAQAGATHPPGATSNWAPKRSGHRTTSTAATSRLHKIARLAEGDWIQRAQKTC